MYVCKYTLYVCAYQPMRTVVSCGPLVVMYMVYCKESYDFVLALRFMFCLSFAKTVTVFTRCDDVPVY